MTNHRNTDRQEEEELEGDGERAYESVLYRQKTKPTLTEEKKCQNYLFIHQISLCFPRPHCLIEWLPTVNCQGSMCCLSKTISMFNKSINQSNVLTLQTHIVFQLEKKIRFLGFGFSNEKGRVIQVVLMTESG